MLKAALSKIFLIFLADSPQKPQQKLFQQIKKTKHPSAKVFVTSYTYIHPMIFLEKNSLLKNKVK